MISPDSQKKIERLQKVIQNGGETKDLVVFDMLIEELSNYFSTSTDSIIEAIGRLQDREEKDTIVNVEAPQVNVEAPVVNVPAPIVNVDAPEVSIDLNTLETLLKDILSKLNQSEPFDLETALAKFIKEDRIKVNVDRVGSGVGGVVTFPIVKELERLNSLSGSSTNGTRDLTSANTWYAVPSTIPTQPYILVVTIENNAGTVRWGFSNTGTPSATNGNLAPGELMVRLNAGQVVYYASSTAGDDVNWLTKVI